VIARSPRRPHPSRSLRRTFVVVGTAGSLIALAGCGGASVAVRSGAASPIGATTTTSPASTEAPTSVVDTTPATPVTSEPTVSTDAPTTTLAPLACLDPSNLPSIVASDVGGYDQVQSQEGLGATDKRGVVYFTSGGAVAAQVGTGTSRSIEYRIGPKSGAGPHGTLDKAVLFDLVPTKQGPQILYGELNPAAPTIVSRIALFDIGSGNSSTVIEVAVDAFNAFHAVAANGLVVSSALKTGGQDISTWAIDGNGILERYSPPVSKPGTAQFFGPASVSSDGKKLAWIEGPDPSKKASRRKGNWTLVVADAVSGSESLRLVLGESTDLFTGFDWDGAWAIVSRGSTQPALAVHTTDKQPTATQICTADKNELVTGQVTLVRHTTLSTDSAVA